MKIIVSRNELLAALLFTSSDESRYVLNGVCVEVRTGTEKPTLIATDGRRLAVVQSQAEQPEVFDCDYQMLLRADFLRPICALSRAFGGKIFPWIEFESKAGSPRVLVSFIGGKFFFEAEENALIEGAYPDWRKVVPDRSLPRAQINDLGLNAAYVADFVRAGKALDAKTPMIQMNLVGEESAIEVKIPGVECFYALVMPCKVDKTVDYRPEFLGIVKDFPVKAPAAAVPAEKPAGAPADSLEPAPTTSSVTLTSETLSKLQTLGSALRAVEEKSDCAEDEELISQCVEVIRSEQKASVSLLQRRLRLGYTRTARIMDELEKRGIVGPAKGAEPRDILIEIKEVVA